MNPAQPLLPPMGGTRFQIMAPRTVSRRIDWLESRRKSHGLSACEEAELEALDRRRIARLCRSIAS